MTSGEEILKTIRPGFVFRVSILIVALFTSCGQKPERAERTPKAVFIIVDGIAADVIEKLNPPVMKAISETGGYARAFVGGERGAFTESPTISAVGYNSLLTATWANKHNVWDNDVAHPNYRYKNIFRIVEEFNPELETAIFSTWTDNRTRLIGEGLAEAGNLVLDYKYDGLELDTLKFPHDDKSDYIHRIDEVVAAEAARYLGEAGPDLSWVYLQYTDDIGHRFGDSEQFHDAILAADKQVGMIWDAVKVREKKFQEDWLIVITTDHGRDSIEGKHHGGQSDRERSTWIVTNARDLNNRFHQTPGVVDIMPSICNHLRIPIPDECKSEIDGVPFIGVADMFDLSGERRGDKLYLEWKTFDTGDSGKAEIFITRTNNFSNGGEDEYRKAGDVSISDHNFTVEADSMNTFYKVLVKGPAHDLNVWIGEE